jgi:hypothetical protein
MQHDGGGCTLYSYGTTLVQSKGEKARLRYSSTLLYSACTPLVLRWYFTGTPFVLCCIQESTSGLQRSTSEGWVQYSGVQRSTSRVQVEYSRVQRSTSRVPLEYKQSTVEHKRSTSGVQAKYEWSTAEYKLSIVHLYFSSTPLYSICTPLYSICTPLYSTRTPLYSTRTPLVLHRYSGVLESRLFPLGSIALRTVT